MPNIQPTSLSAAQAYASKPDTSGFNLILSKQANNSANMRPKKGRLRRGAPQTANTGARQNVQGSKRSHSVFDLLAAFSA